MSKKKFALIIAVIIFLGLMAFSFMFVCLFLYSWGYGDFWFPKLFTIVPFSISLLVLTIYFFNRKQIKSYENKRHDEKVTYAKIYFHCENIGLNPYKKIIASIYKNGFKGKLGEEAYFKKDGTGGDGDVIVYPHILLFKNSKIDENLIPYIKERIKRTESGSFSNKVVGALIFVNEFSETMQGRTINLIRDGLLSKNEPLCCFLLFIDLSNGNLYYPKSDGAFLLPHGSYIKKIIKISKDITSKEMNKYKDFNE